MPPPRQPLEIGDDLRLHERVLEREVADVEGAQRPRGHRRATIRRSSQARSKARRFRDAALSSSDGCGSRLRRMSGQGGAVWRILDRVHRRPEVPVVLCIDVEPDPLVFDPADPPPWLGFERLVQRLPALRRRLSEITGAPAAFTWFLRMDPQVAETWGSPAWVAEKYGGPLAELTGAGDELGLHTHVWRWETKTREWVADFEDPAWGEHCVEMGLDAFETSFGRGCAAHRGGTFSSAGPCSRSWRRGGWPSI